MENLCTDNRVNDQFYFSQIKFNSMVNYDWELKYYRGCLLAVSSKYIAYALRGNCRAASVYMCIC